MILSNIGKEKLHDYEDVKTRRISDATKRAETWLAHYKFLKSAGWVPELFTTVIVLAYKPGMSDSLRHFGQVR